MAMIDALECAKYINCRTVYLSATALFRSQPINLANEVLNESSHPTKGRDSFLRPYDQ